MITLPTLAGVPAVLTAPTSDSLAARCALSLAAPGQVPTVKLRGGRLVEHAVLLREVSSWIAQASKRLSIFRPKLHLTLGAAPPCHCCAGATSPISVWIGNANARSWDSRWTLERRWRQIEQRAPGLAPTALDILEKAEYAGFPVFTPHEALGMAQWTYWMGEADEMQILAEHIEAECDPDEEVKHQKRSHEDLCQHFGIPSRAMIDKAMPLHVSHCKRVLKGPALEQLARRKDATGEIARAAETLHVMTKHAGKGAMLHRQQDDYWCIGTAATVRWSTRDPMARIFDDHANGLFENSECVEEFWGWFAIKGPQDLRGLLDRIEQRFAVAQAMERLLSLIAERTRS